MKMLKFCRNDKALGRALGYSGIKFSFSIDLWFCIVGTDPLFASALFYAFGPGLIPEHSAERLFNGT
jgi:hypothetical protein